LGFSSFEDPFIMKTIGTVATPYGKAEINIGRYPQGGAIFVQLISCAGDDEDDFPGPLATFSVNLKSYGCQISDDEFNVKNWSENECFVEPMLASGLFEDTGRTCLSGYVVSPIWRLCDPAHVPEPLRRKKGGVA
jgi:hypothetical protein